MTKPWTAASFHNDWMKSVFSMAVLNKNKTCMVLYDMVESSYSNEISDIRMCFYLEYSMID